MSLVLITHASLSLAADTFAKLYIERTIEANARNILILAKLGVTRLPAVVRIVGPAFEIANGVREIERMRPIDLAEQAAHKQHVRFGGDVAALKLLD